jgi:hypothetical protein
MDKYDSVDVFQTLDYAPRDAKSRGRWIPICVEFYFDTYVSNFYRGSGAANMGQMF